MDGQNYLGQVDAHYDGDIAHNHELWWMRLTGRFRFASLTPAVNPSPHARMASPNSFIKSA